MAHFSARLANAGSVEVIVPNPRKPLRNPEISSFFQMSKRSKFPQVRYRRKQLKTKKLTISDLAGRKFPSLQQQRTRSSSSPPTSIEKEVVNSIRNRNDVYFGGGEKDFTVSDAPRGRRRREEVITGEETQLFFS